MDTSLINDSRTIIFPFELIIICSGNNRILSSLLTEKRQPDLSAGFPQRRAWLRRPPFFNCAVYFSKMKEVVTGEALAPNFKKSLLLSDEILNFFSCFSINVYMDSLWPWKTL